MGVECSSPSCQQDGQPGRHKHTSRVGIKRLPLVLTVQLRRFDINYQTMQRMKLNDRFEFPLDLDFKEFLPPEEEALAEPSEYSLKAILVHTGSAFAGHYYAYIRDDWQSLDKATDDSGATEWLQFNDSKVTRLNVQALNAVLDCSPVNTLAGMANQDSSKVGTDTSYVDNAPQSVVRCPSNAYMLIYRKKSEFNIDLVPNECIPEDLSNKIEAENNLYREKKQRGITKDLSCICK